MAAQGVQSTATPVDEKALKLLSPTHTKAATQKHETTLRFALGGLSCMAAALVTNPVDVVKTRLQLQGELQSKNAPVKYRGTFGGLKTIVAEEGLRGAYRGITASFMREGSYSAIRMGAYEPIKDLLGVTGKHAPLYKKIMAGGLAGMVGAAIANPTDLVKVRMQATTSQASHYSSTADAFRQIFAKEGLKGLYRGTASNMKRAAFLTATQLPSYDHSKHMALNSGLAQEGLPLHMACSMFAGLMCAITTAPVDNIKTRLMNQRPGDLKYTSIADCFVKTLKAEGPLGLYKGFLPQWLRIGPHTIVTFLVFEKLRALSGIPPI